MTSTINCYEILNREKMITHKPFKRKRPGSDEEIDDVSPPKRVSPYLNTSKQRKDDRRRVLRLSYGKLKVLEDPEKCLRRSVLIRNTVRHLQQEIRVEKDRKHVVGQQFRRSESNRPDDLVFHSSPYANPPPTPFIFDHLCEINSISEIIPDDDFAEALVSESDLCSDDIAKDTRQFCPGIADNLLASTHDKVFLKEIDMLFDSLVYALGES